MNQETKHQGTTAWAAVDKMMAGKPSLVENCRAGGAVALQLYTMRRGHHAASITTMRKNGKAQRAKHTSDPIFPAPGTLLSTALPSGSRNYTKLGYSSGDVSAPPPVNQIYYEQH